MNVAWFRFYEELNDFLPAAKKKVTFPCTFSGNPSVKDVIESLGVPHVEVDMILINNTPADFTFKLKNEDRVSVYPVFESLDISGITHLRNKPLRELKFITDVHLGRLVKYLRLYGFDTLYKRNYSDIEIINISQSERRIILTRDRNLLKNKIVTHGYWIRSPHPGEQLDEVFSRFDMKSSSQPFIRCLECNNLLADISKEEISTRLLPRTSQFYHEYKKCPGCDRIYWEGSHYEKMKKQVKKRLE